MVPRYLAIFMYFSFKRVHYLVVEERNPAIPKGVRSGSTGYTANRLVNVISIGKLPSLMPSKLMLLQ